VRPTPAGFDPKMWVLRPLRNRSSSSRWMMPLTLRCDCRQVGARAWSSVSAAADVGARHPANHTLQKPSISTPAEMEPCFVGVFHTLNQRRAQLYY